MKCLDLYIYMKHKILDLCNIHGMRWCCCHNYLPMTKIEMDRAAFVFMIQGLTRRTEMQEERY